MCSSSESRGPVGLHRHYAWLIVWLALWVPQHGASQNSTPVEPVDPIPIDHVVIVVMQNRSYFNLFGAYPADGAPNLADGAMLLPGDVAPALRHASDDYLSLWNGTEGESYRQLNGQFAVGYYDASVPGMRGLWRVASENAIGAAYFASDTAPVFSDAEHPLLVESTERLLSRGLRVEWFLDDPTQLVGSPSGSQPLPLAQFNADLEAGALPNVSILVPSGPVSTDAAYGPVSRGLLWLEGLVDKLEASPTWEQTVVFVVWDESGGWWDPAPARSLQTGATGKRVPLLVVSPHAKPGYISRRVLDELNIVAFMELVWGTNPGSRKEGARLADFFRGGLGIDEDPPGIDPPDEGNPATTYSAGGVSPAATENQYVLKNGDTMRGPLIMSRDPQENLEAATRQFVIGQTLPLSVSLANKLDRNNDTPVRLGGIRFAGQEFNGNRTIQAAVDDAGETGAVIIPPDYIGDDTWENPHGIAVLDFRNGSLQAGDPLSVPLTYLQKSVLGPFRVGYEPTGDTSDQFATAVLGVMRAAAGGVYNGSQSVFPVFTGENVMTTQGQAIALFGFLQSLGIGNAIWGNSVVECWGGTGNSGEGWAPPECSPLGEFEATQGSNNPYGSIFRATLAANPPRNATTITYSGEINENILGERYLLNKSRVATVGKVTGASGDVLTFTGTRWKSHSPSPVNQYIKLGSSDDLYTPPCSGDDVKFDYLCIGHWYKVIDVISDTELRLDMRYDTVGLTGSFPASYVLMQGAVIQEFDPVANTITLPANNYDWNAGDIIYSPPSHQMALVGLNLILNKNFKTGSGSVASDGMRLINNGEGMMDRGIWISGQPGKGGFRTGIKFDHLNGNVGIDMENGRFKEAAINLGQNNRIRLSSYEELYGGGDGIRLKTRPGGRTLYATDGWNSALVLAHSRMGVVDFVNGMGTTWLSNVGNNTVVWNHLFAEDGISTSYRSAVAQTGQIRLASPHSLNFRSHDGKRDVAGISKGPDDVIALGDAEGIRTHGPIVTPALKVTGTADLGAAVLQLPNGSISPEKVTDALRTQVITYLAGCDSCPLLSAGYRQRTIFRNPIAPMRLLEAWCETDAGEAKVTLKRHDGGGLFSSIPCNTAGETTVAAADVRLRVGDKIDFEITEAHELHRITLSVKALIE